MVATKVLANQRVTVLAGLSSGIANWRIPLLSELTALSNVSGAVNWNSFDMNVKGSDQKDDRTLTDSAGAQSRGFTNFGGKLQLVTPAVTDTTGIYRSSYNLFSTNRVELVVAIRNGKLNNLPPAAGDRWNIFRVITDAVNFGENAVSMYYEVTLVPRDDVMVNYILPPAVAVAVIVTALTSAVTQPALVFASATYQGIDVTKAVTWISSDETKLAQVHPGIFRGVAAGAPTIGASYPGSLAATPVAITVT